MFLCCVQVTQGQRALVSILIFLWHVFRGVRAAFLKQVILNRLHCLSEQTYPGLLEPGPAQNALLHSTNHPECTASVLPFHDIRLM